MTILIYRSGVAIDAMVPPVNATISSDGSTLSWPIPGMTDAGELQAPTGCVFKASSGGAIGWVVDGSGVPVAPTPPAPTQSDLLAYAGNKWTVVSSGGLTVDGALIGTDQPGLTLLNGAVSLATQVPTQAFSWSVPGGKVALTAAQVIAIGVAVGQWIQNTFIALQTLEAQITAGTITTTAQIDAYAWPTN